MSSPSSLLCSRRCILVCTLTTPPPPLLSSPPPLLLLLPCACSAFSAASCCIMSQLHSAARATADSNKMDEGTFDQEQKPMQTPDDAAASSASASAPPTAAADDARSQRLARRSQMRDEAKRDAPERERRRLEALAAKADRETRRAAALARRLHSGDRLDQPRRCSPTESRAASDFSRSPISILQPKHARAGEKEPSEFPNSAQRVSKAPRALSCLQSLRLRSTQLFLPSQTLSLGPLWRELTGPCGRWNGRLQLCKDCIWSTI